MPAVQTEHHKREYVFLHRHESNEIFVLGTTPNIRSESDVAPDARAEFLGLCALQLCVVTRGYEVRNRG